MLILPSVRNLGLMYNDNVRESRNIRMKPSVMRTMCHAAIEVGKTLGQWFEDAIEEKPEREGRENILFEQN